MKSNFTVIQRAIRRALPRDELDKKYILEACLKESNTMLSAFQSELRRVSEEQTSIGVCVTKQLSSSVTNRTSSVRAA